MTVYHTVIFERNVQLSLFPQGPVKLVSFGGLGRVRGHAGWTHPWGPFSHPERPTWLLMLFYKVGKPLSAGFPLETSKKHDDNAPALI